MAIDRRETAFHDETMRGSSSIFFSRFQMRIDQRFFIRWTGFATLALSYSGSFSLSLSLSLSLSFVGLRFIASSLHFHWPLSFESMSPIPPPHFPNFQALLLLTLLVQGSQKVAFFSGKTSENSVKPSKHR